MLKNPDNYDEFEAVMYEIDFYRWIHMCVRTKSNNKIEFEHLYTDS